MLDFVIFAVTFVVALLIAVIYLYPGSSKITTIPGLEPSDSRDGNLGDIGKAGSLHEFLIELHDQFGDIASFWFGPKMVVSIASPELFKQHAAIFDRPSEIFLLFKPLIGPNSLQYANGAEGRRRRQLYDPCFSHTNVCDMVPTFQKISDDLAGKWGSMTKEDHIPLYEHMMALAIKAISISSFGDYFKSDKAVLDLRKNYDLVWHEMEQRLAGDVPAPDSPQEKKFQENKNAFQDTFREMIAHRKNNPPKAGERIAIDAIIEGHDSEESVLSECMTMMIGGFHTSGLHMTWCLYFLASHPEVQEKVYQEMVDVLGEDKMAPSVVNDLKYTRQVLDETLRCSVLAPFAARFQDIDTELGGHVVPKNTAVIHALGVVLMDDRLWPEPCKFDPERFSEENMKEMPPHAFEPFGFAGKRKCPGYRFTYMELTVVLSVLLRKFKIAMVEGQVVKSVHGLVTKPEEEIWITVKKRV